MYKLHIGNGLKMYLKESTHIYTRLVVYNNGDCNIDTIKKPLEFRDKELEEITADEWNAAWEVVNSHK